MKSGIFRNPLRSFFLTLIYCIATPVMAQDMEDVNFWQRLQYGGSFALGFGNGYTDVTLAPGVIYPFNDYFAAGAGLQGSYINQRNFFTSYLYGGSVIGLFNPISEIQLSAEVEQLRVNLEGGDAFDTYKRDFWNTALFLGAGFRTGNATLGVRYNVLFKENDRVYSNALMPFIRVYF